MHLQAQLIVLLLLSSPPPSALLLMMKKDREDEGASISLQHELPSTCSISHYDTFGGMSDI